jgi:hypothetical protein
VNVPSVGKVKTEALILAERPGPLWNLLKGTVEGLLAQVTSGKAQGRGNVNLIIGFEEPLGPEDLATALAPFAMAGGERIKTAWVKVTPEGVS